MDDLHAANLRQLQQALRNGTTTSAELVEAHIRRIEQVNPIVNGLAANRFNEARKEAAQADTLLGKSNGNLKPLQGIPCTIKEFLGIAGMPQTGGVLWRRDVKATTDATVVGRLRNAGAIILGSTNVPEGGLWLETYNSIYGRTNNPWDPKRTSGGSSGGEGALVAAGASPFGIGSDVGGSIRIPAAFCGTVGHKPSGGLVPNTGHFPEDVMTVEGGRYLTVGPLTRTVDDAWTVLKVIAGSDGRDPSTIDYPLGDPDRVDLTKVTVYPLAWNMRSQVTDDVRTAVFDSARVLEEAGATLSTHEFPGLKKGFEIWSAMMSEATEVCYPEMLGESGPLNPLWELSRLMTGFGRHTFAAIMMCGADRISAALPGLARKYIEAGKALQHEIENVIGDNGVIIHPPYNRPAPRHWDAFRTPFVPSYTAIFNVMEFPVTVLPVGFSKHQLPIGVQVVAKRGNDHLTIAAARTIERALGGWRKAMSD